MSEVKISGGSLLLGGQLLSEGPLHSGITRKVEKLTLLSELYSISLLKCLLYNKQFLTKTKIVKLINILFCSYSMEDHLKH